MTGAAFANCFLTIVLKLGSQKTMILKMTVLESEGTKARAQPGGEHGAMAPILTLTF